MSFYNPGLNALFIHVPKTAGTSMKRSGRHFDGGTHGSIRGFDVPDDTFKFAFVRNPWDRLVSCLFFHKEYRGTGQKGFDNFIEKQCVPCLDIGGYPHNNRPHAFIPMHHYLLDKDGGIGVDYVGRFEILEHDWEVVCEIMGINEPLIHARKFKHEHYESYYTPESWDVIGKIYERDIELFGYGSEL